ncbi:MAG: prepilin-type N-terminal cleavage/methylation domain-containing protein [Planctomycetota bacterium]
MNTHPLTARPQRTHRSRPAAAFTLIELLVVISIIALLIGILLPVLGSARGAARASVSMSQIKQLNLALAVYATEEKDYMPMHSSSSDPTHPAFADPRTRWFDYLYPYMETIDVFVSPNLDEEQLAASTRYFAHTNTGTYPGGPVAFAGYGYNFQYLGNSRFNPTFHRNLSDITAPSDTVAVGDCSGSRAGTADALPGHTSQAVYAIDPPLMSARTAHPDGRAYYAGGSTNEPTGTPTTYLYRSWTMGRNVGDSANVSFLDGHTEAVGEEDLDDYDSDGNKDNGYFNGYGDANKL